MMGSQRRKMQMLLEHGVEPALLDGAMHAWETLDSVGDSISDAAWTLVHGDQSGRRQAWVDLDFVMRATQRAFNLIEVAMIGAEARIENRLAMMGKQVQLDDWGWCDIVGVVSRLHTPFHDTEPQFIVYSDAAETELFIPLWDVENDWKFRDKEMQ